MPEYVVVDGNGYYNWYAATAGSGNFSSIYQTASDSLCPNGWQLPNVAGNKSYGYLFKDAYELIKEDGNGNSMAVLDSKTYPFLFTPNGMYKSDVKAIVSAGGAGIGYYQTNYAISKYGSTHLYIQGDYFHTERNYSIKADGISVRCVLK